MASAGEYMIGYSLIILLLVAHGLKTGLDGNTHIHK